MRLQTTLTSPLEILINKGAFLHNFYNRTLLNMCAQVVCAVVFFTRSHWQNIQLLNVADKFCINSEKGLKLKMELIEASLEGLQKTTSKEREKCKGKNA